MSRDRHCAIEWGANQKGQRVREFGYCDNGFRLACREEAAVYQQLKDEGYQVTKHGWPDFLATRNDEIRFIEVKSENDTVKSSQKRVYAAFAASHIPVEIHHIRDTQRSCRKRKRRRRATRDCQPRQQRVETVLH